MALGFASDAQENLFQSVTRHLEGIGYRGSLLLRNYDYVDWFDPATPSRSVPLAAFATAPPSYNTACIGVAIANGVGGDRLVDRMRALGAPFALEIESDRVVQWVVGSDHTKTRAEASFGQDTIDQIFERNKERWSGPAILREKNIAIWPGQRQLDFFDQGLIPAIEKQVQSKLHTYIKESIYAATRRYSKDLGREPDASKLFRTAFRIITAKVLHDRDVPEFWGLTPDRPLAILRQAERYYSDDSQAIDHLPAVKAMVDALWNRISFANVSVEMLAYIYENTFVDDGVRQTLGIHGTPYNLARYIAYNLIDEIPPDGRLIVEPCCGHGIFLVAALQRLRELLPGRLSPEKRHARLVNVLAGYDKESFSVEVAKLSLSLADYPSGNGWNIEQSDVFESPRFEAALGRAKIVLCNPPFRDFSAAERRANESIVLPRRPAELLRRTLLTAPKDALLGFILPRSFLDGGGYRDIRREIAERYRDVSLVALPDRVFFESDVETAVLIAKNPVAGSSTTVSFIHIREKDRGRFLSEYSYPVLDREKKTPEQAAANLKVVALKEVWDFLEDHPVVADFSEVHRGIEYHAVEDRADFSIRYTRTKPDAGFRLGYHRAEGLKSFYAPQPVYLSAREDDLRGGAIDYRWDDPKVVMSASRVSRDPWCVAAFADERGLLCYQNLTAIWPSGIWTPQSLVAVINGPLASAFVAVREDKIHIRIRDVIKRIPLPKLSQNDILSIELLVALLQRVNIRGASGQSQAKKLLLEIDAKILRGYGLPPRLEKVLLDYFRGYTRPLPFTFGDYFPEDLESFVTLEEYISPSYKNSTGLDILRNAPEITDPDLLDILAELE